MSDYFQRVPLTINHDWELTVRAAKKMQEFEQHAKSSTYPPDAGAEGSAHYDLKSLGVLSKHYKSASWYRMAGPMLDRTMPFLKNMLLVMTELGPDGGAVSFLSGNGGEHVDQDKDLSAVNYIFYNTDPEAHTYVTHGNYYGTYPSVVGEAWILDSTVRHGLKNSGDRWNLSIHFSVPYQVLREWFDQRTPEQLIF
jgi:hypothetical protein